MQIAHLDSSRGWRGGQQQLLLLARELRRLGCEQTIVAREAEAAERLRAEGFAVMAPGRSAWRQVRQAEIAHAHDGRAHSWLLAATWRGGGVRVLSRRVAYAIGGAGSGWKYRRLDLAIAVSEYIRRQVLETGMAAERVVVIPDGVAMEELPEPTAARARVRERMQAGRGAAPETRWLVCLGALTPEKGVGDLIAALAGLPEEYVAVLSGEGPEEAGLQRQARELGVERRVWFAAAAEFTPAEWAAAADVLVMPSREEGLGSAALLAMALERPIVATRAGGIPELVEDGVTGRLVEAGNAPGLAAACLEALSQPELTKRFTAAGALRARERHSSAATAAATLAAYRKRLDLRKRRKA